VIHVTRIVAGKLESLAITVYEFSTLAFIQAGVMTMRQILMPIGALGVLLMVGLAAPLAAPAAKQAARQAAKEEGPCGQVTAACERAGFARGAAGGGAGLQVDCINPIMQGGSQPKRVRKALPQIDPQVVEACKASNPAFGQGKAPPLEPVAQPVPAGPPPAVQNTPSQGAGGKRPNIVFILTDDLALNLVQYMPHVVKMQKDGVTFANYFVTDSLCCPSRSSIFTGRFPHDTGIFRNTGNDGGFRAFHNRHHELSTFATALTAAGYRAAMMGKYLNGYKPQNNPPEPGWSLWEVAGNGYPEFNYDFSDNGKFVRAGNQPTDYLTDVVAAKAVGFIKQSAGAPFAIEVATFAPHAPYTPAPRDADAFPDLRAPRTAAFNATPDANAPQWLKTYPALSAGEMARIDTDFRKRAQSVQAVDKMIGELQAAVASIGEEKNTYFVFSSDNGYHMGEHRLMPGKMTAFDTDIHVPLVVTGPGIAPGRVVQEIADNIDLNPTFAEIGGAATAANVDGRSLVPLLHGRAVTEWRKAALVEHHGMLRDTSDPDFPGKRSGNPPTYEAIRGSTWVYVEYDGGEKEYYDRTTDPDELHNSYASLPNDQKVSLHAMLTALQNCHDAQGCSAADGSTRSAARK
jgi:N-acetylglucosamine-6-sulfatase